MVEEVEVEVEEDLSAWPNGRNGAEERERGGGRKKEQVKEEKGRKEEETTNWITYSRVNTMSTFSCSKKIFIFPPPPKKNAHITEE